MNHARDPIANRPLLRGYRRERQPTTVNSSLDERTYKLVHESRIQGINGATTIKINGEEGTNDNVRGPINERIEGPTTTATVALPPIVRV